MEKAEGWDQEESMPSEAEHAEQLREAMMLLSELAQHPESRLLLAMFRRIANLDARRLTLVGQFTQQIVEIHDPDAVATFLAWREHPVLDTILLLAAKLEEPDQYEIVGFAEGLLNDAQRPRSSGGLSGR
jgi:hypothetical protein